MAQRHPCRVRLIQRQRAPVSQQRHYRARHLLLARAARTHHRLLHPQRCVFENRFLPQRRRRDRRTARRTEDLRRLKILHKNRLLERHVPDVLRRIQKRRHRPMNLSERHRHRQFYMHLHRLTPQQNRLPAHRKLDQRQTRPA